MYWQLPRLPFFDEEHYRLAERVRLWCESNRPLLQTDGRKDFARVCRELAYRLASAGLLDYVLPRPGAGGATEFDSRSICVIREGLAYESNLAATIFILQGMGLHSLCQHADPAFRDRYVDRARRGDSLAAVAITEPSAGSDVAAVAMTAIREGNEYRLDGQKVWIANGAIADHYLVIARTSDAAGGRGLSAFMVDANLSGLTPGPVVEMIDDCALAHVSFVNVRVPAVNRIGEVGEGFKTVMAGFDLFRPSVGAAAVGMAKRALTASIDRVQERNLFGKRMDELGAVQARLAEMMADIEVGALMVYRAAWSADVLGGRRSTEAALAKLIATEAAQRVVDAAVQLFGAQGVARGSLVERLYRELRPLRIYEGASEIQKIVIARGILSNEDG